ncbi:hypothetical protein ACWEKT_26240 [Nocardia takedensis]
MIVVDAHPFRGFRHRYRLLFEVSRTRLREFDATLSDLWIVTGHRPGARWFGLSENTRGVLPPATVDGYEDGVTDPARGAETTISPTAAPVPVFGTLGPPGSVDQSRAR